MLLEAMVKAKIGAPARFNFDTMGSRKSTGKSARTSLTALRTSSSASWVDFSNTNSAVNDTVPSVMVA